MTRRKQGDKCDWLKRKVKFAADQVRFDQLKGDIAEQVANDKWLADISVPMPILHNEDLIILQYSGWSINLYPDGTYWVQVTEGG